jgi:prepilin-type N-terminal cleavage/methylation domain-containing protein
MASPRSRRGFSLTEIAVTVLVVAVALVQLLPLLSGGSREALLDEYHVMAQGLALAVIERTHGQLVREGFRTLEQTREPTGSGTRPENFGQTGRAAPIDPAANLWKVSARVWWSFRSDPPGISHEVKLERLVCRSYGSFTGRFPYRRGVPGGE